MGISSVNIIPNFIICTINIRLLLILVNKNSIVFLWKGGGGLLDFKWLKASFGYKLLLFMFALLLMSGIFIGVPSYYIAVSELDLKGEMVLKNSVEGALHLIEAKQEAVSRGELTLEEAQEQVREALIGKKNTDGTRTITSSIDLGKDGYFVAYSRDGVELMHPMLEGQNVWEVTSKGKDAFYLVQDQIAKGLNGGGFTYYSWELPHSQLIGAKVSYAKLEPRWNWVVVATSYMASYNAGAVGIMRVMVFTLILLLGFGGIISYRYVKASTKPIEAVAEAMKDAEVGLYKPIESLDREDEIGQLVEGFNSMVSAIHSAYEDLLAQQQKADFYAYYDRQSGLPNMNRLREYVGERMAEEKLKGQMVLLQISVYDNLVSLYGSEYGEDLMCRIGGFIAKYQEDSNQIARVSVSEFAAWIEQWSESQLIEQLFKLKMVLDIEIENWGFGKLVDYAIGFSKFPKDGDNFDTCFQMASIALNHAKTLPERIMGFDDALYRHMDQEAKMLEEAALYLNSDAFYPVYQGKYHEGKGCFIGVEALARWDSIQFGSVSPGIFIPMLTKAGLMHVFSEVMLEKVMMGLEAVRQRYGPEVSVSVNIPHEFFYREDLLSLLDELMIRHQVPPQAIVLEITEDTFIRSTAFISAQINALRAKGIKVSLDDFGTGYSSLNYLTTIRFDEIKIDKRFIDDLQHSERARQLLTHIVALAKTFDAEVVAEGVESKEQVEIIVASGCDIIQGYIYSKPHKIH